MVELSIIEAEITAITDKIQSLISTGTPSAEVFDAAIQELLLTKRIYAENNNDCVDGKPLLEEPETTQQCLGNLLEPRVPEMNASEGGVGGLRSFASLSDEGEMMEEEGIWKGFLVRVDPETGTVVMLSSKRRLDENRWKDENCGSFESYPALQFLDLYKCRYIERLHKSVVHLQSLKSLKLSRCSELKALPEDIGSLSSLEVLDLTDCINVSHLPDSIGELKRLKFLSMGSAHSSGNKVLKGLPESLGYLVSLQELILDKCKSLEGLPSSMGRLGNLRELQMRECKSITSLPDSIGCCTSLVELGLSKCTFLTTLPDSIQRLTNLEDLVLTKCKAIISLPDGIGSCRSLSLLDLRGCKNLLALPDSIGQLINLKYLDLSSCKVLITLPRGLGNLPKLQYLDVTNCLQLKVVPVEVLAKPDIVVVGWNVTT